MEPHQFRGNWWIPGQRQYITGGVARFTQDNSIELELFDTSDGLPLSSEFPETVNQIIGVTEEGKAVTLKNCMRTSGKRKTTPSAHSSPKHTPPNSYLLVLFFVNSNPAFDSLKIEFPLLEEWLERASPIIDTADLSLPIVQPRDVLRLEYEIPDVPKARIHDIEYSIPTAPDINSEQSGLGEISVSNYWKISPRRSQVPLTEYLNIINTLQDFMTLALGKPVQPKQVTGRVTDSDRENDVSIFYSLAMAIDNPSKQHPSNMLFQFSDIEDRFEAVLGKWFSKSEILSPVFNLYFGAQYSDSVYTESKFLSLTQAIEAYHRRTMGGKYIDSEKYDRILDDFREFLKGDIVNIFDFDEGNITYHANISNKYELDNSFKMHLSRGTFKYANEYSLRKRLSQVIEKNTHIINKLPGNIESRQRQVIDTRNYLTHYDEKEEAVTDAGLIQLVWGLEQLLEICLLTEIGISDDHIIERLQYRYQDRSWTDF